ncbi:MAG: hypothetical protein ABI811_00200, partial [Acidobacteriota bacterium]
SQTLNVNPGTPADGRDHHGPLRAAFAFHSETSVGEKIEFVRLRTVTKSRQVSKIETPSGQSERADLARAHHPWQNRDKTPPVEPTWVAFERKADSPSC